MKTFFLIAIYFAFVILMRIKVIPKIQNNNNRAARGLMALLLIGGTALLAVILSKFN